MEGDALWLGGAPTSCAGQAFGWSGGGNGYKTEVWVDQGGGASPCSSSTRARTGTAQFQADQAAHDALARLYCAA